MKNENDYFCSLNMDGVGRIVLPKEETYKKHRNLCGRIRRVLIASCKTLKENVK